MPQPNIRTFCFMPKNNEIWNNKISRNIWFGIFTSLLLLVYDFIGFRYIYRHHFFSISWKLTSLFLIANLVPIFILAFVTNRYITNKKISLKNEIIEDIERTMRDLDIEYRYFFEQYSMKINYFADDISKKTGLPVYCTTVRRDIFDRVKNSNNNDAEFNELSEKITNLYPIDIFVKTVWQQNNTFMV